MASYLVVDVIRATIIAKSIKRTTLNCCVEVHYNNQSFTTSIKRSATTSYVGYPAWNERFCFQLLTGRDRSGDMFQAWVYEVNGIGESKTLLGTTEKVPWIYFIRGPGYTTAPARCPLTMASDTSIGFVLMKAFEIYADRLDTFSGQCHPRSNSCTADPLPSSSVADGESLVSLSTVDEDGTGASVPKEISPPFGNGRIVEIMQYLFVRVIRAHNLPDMDVNGSLDPFVEVRFGVHKSVTDHKQKNKNPEWNTTFGFSLMGDKSPPTIHVIVMDKDVVRNETVGELEFNLRDIPIRSTLGTPLLPTRYPLRLKGQQRKAYGEEQPHLVLAVWIGSQDDEAYRDALISDSIVGVGGIPTAASICSRVHETPMLWCVRISTIEVRGISSQGQGISVEACLGVQRLRTGVGKEVTTNNFSYAWKWNEDLAFVVDLSLDESLVITVKEGRANDDEVIGRVLLRVSDMPKQDGDDNLMEQAFMYRLERPVRMGTELEQGAPNEARIRLTCNVHGAYHVPCGGYHSAYWSTDGMRSSVAQSLRKRPIGSLELGILRATCLQPQGTNDGRSEALNPYCVARYGGRWCQTRTAVNTADPVFNEQYRWDVYDTATTLTVAIFDSRQLQVRDRAASMEMEDAKLGKVRIRLSCLETGRIYAHSYPLDVLHPSGVCRTGEVQLAVRLIIFSTSWPNMVRAYTRPALPKMQYERPLSAQELRRLQDHAIWIVARQLSRVDPPLRSEVVKYMSGAGPGGEGYHLWSVRKSRISMLRVLEALAGVISFIRWFHDVHSWNNPAATVIVHAIFFMALWFHHLVLPSLFLSVVLRTVWNYRKRPTYPAHLDLKMSQVDAVTPDDLAEEYDASMRGQTPEVVAARYDRLRSIAGRVQVITGDLASLGEKIRALVSWKDPRATAIFELFALLAVIMIYLVPLKVLAAVAWLYITRPPILRRSTSSFLLNFINRLPSEAEALL